MRWIGVLVATVAVLSLGGPARAIDFSGKRIEFIVPFGPGGGSTLHARLLATLLEQELPGNPTIVVRNIEGAASVRGLNYFDRVAKPDGLTIAALGTASYFNYMLGVPEVKYRLPEYIPIVASPSGVIVYGRADLGLVGDPLKDLQTLKEATPVLAGAGPTTGDMPILYCYSLLGVQIHAVWGLSSGEARQAFLRGESQVNHDSTTSLAGELADMIADGTAVPLFTLGLQTEGGFERDPSVPEVPTCLELYRMLYGIPLSGVAREVHDCMFAVRMLAAKSIVLPPGTSEEIVRAYDEAMARVVRRPELQDGVGRSILGDYEQLIGAEARSAHAAATAIGPAAKRELTRWLVETWDVGL